MLQSLQANPALKGPKLANLSPLKAPASKEAAPSDVVSLGNVVAEPVLAGRPSFPASVDKAAEAPLALSGLGTASRVGVGLLAGLSLMTALTGCTQSTAPKVVETQAQQDARSAFSKAIGDLEKEMSSTKAGDGHQQAESFASKFLDKAGEYTKKVGQGGQVALNGIQTELRDHPAMAATVVFALGATAGVALEHYGVPENIKDGVANVTQWVKDNPIKSIAIGAVAAAGIGALVVNYSSQMEAVKTQIPAKPQTAEAKVLDESFTSIEQGLNTPGGSDSKTVTTKVMDAISKYQKTTHKAWNDVTTDVKAFAYDHPILAATVVAGAGVGTGVLLEKAGVPKEVADITGGAFAYGQSTASSAVDWAKAHPLVTGAGAAVVAAGVGYLAYEHFHTETPAAAK